MPLFQIKESASGHIAQGHGCDVPGSPESENGDGTVNFRVQGAGVILRDGDLVRVPKDAVERR
jgi:hypothetical protein